MSFPGGREVPLMDEHALLEKLIADLDSRSAEAGLPILDEILALQGRGPTDEALRNAYVDGLLGLLDKAPEVGTLAEIDARLRQTPCYAANDATVLRHAQALVDLVSKRHSFSQAMATAAAVAAIKGYGSSLNLQKAHAQALMNAAQVPGAQPLHAVEAIAAIPSFRDSDEIQLSGARTLCNATASAASLKEIDRAVGMLEQLPLRKGNFALEQCLERAVRNRSRFLELRTEAKKQPPPRTAMVAAGAFLAVALVSAPFVVHRSKAGASAIPQPVASGPSAPERDLAGYLAKAQKAMSSSDMDQATTYGLMSLRLAESLGKTGEKDDSLDVLAAAYTRLGQEQQAKGYLEQISQAALAGFAQSHLDIAREAFARQQAKVVGAEAGVAVHQIALLKTKPDNERLEAMAVTLQQCERPAEASLMWEKAGQLAKAAESAEQAEDPERALTLLKQLAQSNPAEKARLLDFRLRCGTDTTKKAETAFTEKNHDLARSLAQAGLSLLEPLPMAGEEKARCLTVLAKVAYGQERYPEAARLAVEAKSASPNPDRKARAQAYTSKDAELVTVDELDVDTFVFPPARRSEKFYTYACYFGAPGDFVSSGGEELFDSPRSEIVAGLSYSKPDQGVTVRLRTYDGRYYSFSFDAGGDRELQPGTYDQATRTPFNYDNPGLDFSGNGRGCNTSRGKFVVHEVAIDSKRQVTRFAADFISDCEAPGRGAVFGKVRYNSNFE